MNLGPCDVLCLIFSCLEPYGVADVAGNRYMQESVIMVNRYEIDSPTEIVDPFTVI